MLVIVLVLSKHSENGREEKGEEKAKKRGQVLFEAVESIKWTCPLFFAMSPFLRQIAQSRLPQPGTFNHIQRDAGSLLLETRIVANKPAHSARANERGADHSALILYRWGWNGFKSSMA